jgi:hypothetical protein
MEVPDQVRNVEGEPMYAEVIEDPGANTSRHRPQLEKEARVSLWVEAPTVIAAGADAGE